MKPSVDDFLGKKSDNNHYTMPDCRHTLPNWVMSFFLLLAYFIKNEFLKTTGIVTIVKKITLILVFSPQSFVYLRSL